MTCADKQLSFSPYANFLDLLKMTHISTPREGVLDQVRLRLVHLLAGVSTPAHAAELYERAAGLPASDTTKHLMQEHGLAINGPRFLRCVAHTSACTALSLCCTPVRQVALCHLLHTSQRCRSPQPAKSVLRLPCSMHTADC